MLTVSLASVYAEDLFYSTNAESHYGLCTPQEHFPLAENPAYQTIPAQVVAASSRTATHYPSR